MVAGQITSWVKAFCGSPRRTVNLLKIGDLVRVKPTASVRARFFGALGLVIKIDSRGAIFVAFLKKELNTNKDKSFSVFLFADSLEIVN